MPFKSFFNHTLLTSAVAVGHIVTAASAPEAPGDCWSGALHCLTPLSSDVHVVSYCSEVFPVSEEGTTITVISTLFEPVTSPRTASITTTTVATSTFTDVNIVLEIA